MKGFSKELEPYHGEHARGEFMQALTGRKSICRNCRYFYITWDPGHPYGCKAMGFKSRNLPYMITRQVSGQECLSFVAKDKK